MLELLWEQIFTGGIATFGSASLYCIFLMAVFFFLFLFFGLEFDYALIVISPLPYAFYQSGYIEVWVCALFMVFPLGIGLYSIWLKFTNK